MWNLGTYEDANGVTRFKGAPTLRQSQSAPQPWWHMQFIDIGSEAPLRIVEKEKNTLIPF